MTITGRYDGELSCTSRHGLSGTELVTDAPPDNQGLGRTFSPTDLLATSLGTCMMTIMGIWARRNGIELKGSTFSVEKRMSTDAPRRVAGLKVSFEIHGTLTDEQKRQLEAAARACPVHHSLHPDLQSEVTFAYANA